MISPETEDRIERAKSPRAEIEFSIGSEDDELETNILFSGLKTLDDKSLLSC